MFVNCSNHPCDKWGGDQMAAAMKYGEVLDYPFPEVAPNSSEEEIKRLAMKIAGEILALRPDAVMCQGEFTLTFSLVDFLLEKGVRVVAACSERKVQELIREDGTCEKKAQFQFVGFREYVRTSKSEKSE